MNRIEYFASSYLNHNESTFSCSKRINIETTGWFSVSLSPYACLHTQAHTLLSFPLVRQLKSYYVNPGSLLPIRQARAQSIPVFLKRIPNNQKLWLFCWKATAWWKDVPVENDSDHIFVRRMRCLQLPVTNHIRGGKQECFTLQKITLIMCWNTTCTGCLSQNSDIRHPVTGLASW